MAEGPTAWDRGAHRRALMMSRRCASCAERVGPEVLLRGRPCPHCGRPSPWPAGADAESVIVAIERRWRGRRWWIYGAVTISTGLTGFLPIVPTLVTVGFMIYLRYALMRAPLEWFSPGRRFACKLTLKLWMMAVGCLTLGLNALFALIPVGNLFLNALVGLASTALFVEVALWSLRTRLRREAYEGPELWFWEWALPAGLLGSVLALGAGALLVVIVTWELITAG